MAIIFHQKFNCDNILGLSQNVKIRQSAPWSASTLFYILFCACDTQGVQTSNVLNLNVDLVSLNRLVDFSNTYFYIYAYL